ncbi:hypothetical protein F4679DRAFT_258433 [Xylaria curta]|nr:hypothetical protein F4679DRAFT_258433 [Xylaria curta]
MSKFQKLHDRISFGGSYPPVPVNWGPEFTKTTHFDTYPSIDPTKRSNCSGKAVLITGGNKGIGFGIALSYARAGASHIAITSRSEIATVITEEIKKAATDAGRCQTKAGGNMTSPGPIWLEELRATVDLSKMMCKRGLIN